jgi:CRP/FNR family transcriptional regulator, cyclic AMP receptor protein
MQDAISIQPRESEAGAQGPSIPSAAIDFLSLMSPANQCRILAGSTRTVFPAGTVVTHPASRPQAYLIDQGLARLYWNVPDGRQATIAIVRPKELAGGSVALGGSPWVFMQVLTESKLTVLDVAVLRRVAAEELEVSAAIGAHLAMRVRDAYRLIAVRSLGNIRERVAYDLIDRAAHSQLVVGRLEVRATQADLADSIGSSREVMSRALRDLRHEGLVETAPGVIRVVNPAGLAAIVRAFVI